MTMGIAQEAHELSLPLHASPPSAPSIDASLAEMVDWVSRQCPSTGTEALRQLRAASPDSPLTLLAARQRAGRLLRALGEHRKQRVDAFEIARAVGAGARQHRAHGEVLGDRERRKDLAALGDLTDAEIADAMARPAGDVGAAIED